MPRQNIQNMTPQEMAQYVETVRARNRINAKNYYNNKIKTDPEKYEKFKLKCAKASKKYYSRADYRLEQAEDQALLRFLQAEEASERMPFANMFGHDTMKNFTYCIQTMQTDFMGPFLAPSNYTNVVAAENIKTSVKNNKNSMGMFAYLRDTVTNNFSGLYNVFGSLGLILEYMVNKIKDMIQKVTGIYMASFSVLQASGITAQSTWDALPGKLLRALPT